MLNLITLSLVDHPGAKHESMAWLPMIQNSSSGYTGSLETHKASGISI